MYESCLRTVGEMAKVTIFFDVDRFTRARQSLKITLAGKIAYFGKKKRRKYQENIVTYYLAKVLLLSLIHI